MATKLALRGYPKLANLMARHGGTAMFRRFGPLNMLNLMSLQAELIDLEVQFKDTCREDDESDSLDEKIFTSDFWTLRRSQNSNSEQWRLMLEIRAKLREYNSILLQVSQIAGLGSPEAADSAFLRDWLVGDDPLEGNGFLRGREVHTWSQAHLWDLVALAKQEEEEDPISKWLSKHVLKIYHARIGVRKENRKDPESGAYFYKTPPIGSVITTILSSTVPILTILVLYFVKDTLKRIGIMIAFTMVFAGVLSIFTSAKRVEVFAATAALAAVEVVFIGNSNTA